MSDESTGRSDGRKLKNLLRVNYNNMNATEFDESQCATRGLPVVRCQGIYSGLPLKLKKCDN